MVLKRMYIVMGVLGLLLTGGMILLAVMAKAAPAPMVYIILSLTVMCFCLAYLYPQFKQKDERTTYIRQKGMFISYFALLFYYFILMTIIQFELLTLTAMDVLYILCSLTIITVFLSWVILARQI
ncbi:permease [Paenibacillus septentrionalis]|uniref:Permease n=1 Tax=Paenibacillus septentrionalis TaxID=429342 RepID=A0ABW1V6L7_9BACL